MTPLRCYNCGSDQHGEFAEENGFSLVRCSHCGLLYVENPPSREAISQAHVQGRHDGSKELDTTGSFDRSKICRYLDVLGDLFGGRPHRARSWLDVGCGHGEFMLAVRQFSGGAIAVEGSEPNEQKRRSAIAHGLRVSFHDLDAHSKTYDVISLLNVYSHLPDPPAFLTSLKRLLTPGGELILETGDSAGLSAKEHHRPFYLPDHLSFASEAIVVAILERLGFEIVAVRKYPFPPFEWLGLVRELVKTFVPSRESGLRYYLRRQKYSQLDMYIRARLKP